VGQEHDIDAGGVDASLTQPFERASTGVDQHPWGGVHHTM